MCGRKALQYVRFRHEDTDLVRSARRQDFLRQAKQQIGVGGLIGSRDLLIEIFGKHTTSDIRGRSRCFACSSSPSSRSTSRCARSTSRARSPPGARSRTAPATSPPATRPCSDSCATSWRGVTPSPPRSGKRRRRPKENGDAGLEKAEGAGKEQGVQAAQAGAGGDLPVFYPTSARAARSSPGRRGCTGCEAGRPDVRRLPDGPQEGRHRRVLRPPGPDLEEPPILDDPTEIRRIGSRRYELHYDGDRLRLVAHPKPSTGSRTPWSSRFLSGRCWR